MLPVLLIVTFLLLAQGYVGLSSRSGRYHPPVPALIPYGMASLGISLAILAGLLCFRNYYLLDPLEHRLYHSSDFLWRRKRRILFRQQGILGITTEGNLQRTRYGTYWNYRLVAVGLDGRKERFERLETGRPGKMERQKPGELAGLLGCQSYAAPSKSAPAVKMEGRTPIGPDFHRLAMCMVWFSVKYLRGGDFGVVLLSDCYKRPPMNSSARKP